MGVGRSVPNPDLNDRPATDPNTPADTSNCGPRKDSAGSFRDRFLSRSSLFRPRRGSKPGPVEGKPSTRSDDGNIVIPNGPIDEIAEDKQGLREQEQLESIQHQAACVDKELEVLDGNRPSTLPGLTDKRPRPATGRKPKTRRKRPLSENLESEEKKPKTVGGYRGPTHFFPENVRAELKRKTLSRRGETGEEANEENKGKIKNKMSLPHSGKSPPAVKPKPSLQVGKENKPTAVPLHGLVQAALRSKETAEQSPNVEVIAEPPKKPSRSFDSGSQEQSPITPKTPLTPPAVNDADTGKKSVEENDTTPEEVMLESPQKAPETMVEAVSPTSPKTPLTPAAVNDADTGKKSVEENDKTPEEVLLESPQMAPETMVEAVSPTSPKTPLTPPAVNDADTGKKSVEENDKTPEEVLLESPQKAPETMVEAVSPTSPKTPLTPPAVNDADTGKQSVQKNDKTPEEVLLESPQKAPETGVKPVSPIAPKRLLTLLTVSDGEIQKSIEKNNKTPEEAAMETLNMVLEKQDEPISCEPEYEKVQGTKSSPLLNIPHVTCRSMSVSSEPPKSLDLPPRKNTPTAPTSPRRLRVGSFTPTFGNVFGRSYSPIAEERKAECMQSQAGAEFPSDHYKTVRPSVYGMENVEVSGNGLV